MSHQELNEAKEIKLKKWGNESLKYLYKEYYSLNPPLILPKDIKNREFAFQLFESTSYVRHISFDNERKFLEYLTKNVPKQVYYSIAVYDLPEASTMEEKGWRGSDLLFDLDLDHMKDCKIVEDIADDECIENGIKYVNTISLIVDNFLGGYTQIYFTGNRGYHVRGFCDYCKQLGKDERIEIANFIAAQGIDLDLIFPKSSKAGKAAKPNKDDPGWRGLIARNGLKDEFDGEDIINIVKSIKVDIDIMVTQDPSRLTRIPGTLNGKASLLVVPICGEFKMGKWLSPFSGNLDVKAEKELNEMKILGQKVSFKEKEDLNLPAQLAIFLFTKKYINVIGGDVVVRKNTGWWPIQGCNWTS
ncbi:MAG: DNA primase small subunit PriS [Caldisphaera sp.]|jgi:DNA primase small subunit|nr:DNA primase small subunit PriS [Caldisphaera sp.]PMP59425.1 MAG: DNA primase [Caldisphaera sp.]